MEPETVRCERHGGREAAFVCQHLLTGSGRGWVTIESGSPQRPDAICSDCDAAWRAAGDEFTEAVQELVRIRVVCAECYDELHERP